MYRVCAAVILLGPHRPCVLYRSIRMGTYLDNRRDEDLETSGWLVCLISVAGFLISLFAGSIYAYNHKTFRYIWLPVCVMGFCVCTAFVHLFILSIFILSTYDDVGGPSYDTYKDWGIYDFIWSDVKRLVLWVGIGILNYLAFIRQKRIFKYLIFAGACVFLLLILIILFFSSSITLIDMDAL